MTGPWSHAAPVSAFLTFPAPSWPVRQPGWNVKLLRNCSINLHTRIYYCTLLYYCNTLLYIAVLLYYCTLASITSLCSERYIVWQLQSSAVLFSAVHYSVVVCIAVQCSTVQCSAVQCSAVLCSAVPCSSMLYWAVQCAMQCSAGRLTKQVVGHIPGSERSQVGGGSAKYWPYIVRYCTEYWLYTALYYIVLYYIVLYCIVV